jgi:hypothetical protein
LIELLGVLNRNDLPSAEKRHGVQNVYDLLNGRACIRCVQVEGVEGEVPLSLREGLFYGKERLL